jgi:hypothetical protein
VTIPVDEIGWTPNTLYLYTERRFTEMDRRFAEAMAAQKEALEKFEDEVSQRFDGTDKNFEGLRNLITTLGTTISQRSGALNLLARVIPNLIALASIAALIYVSGH